MEPGLWFKRMRPGNRAPLSWPHPGFMLSLDFPIAPGPDRLCAEWQRVRDSVDPERVFVSDLARRVRLVEGEPATARR